MIGSPTRRSRRPTRSLRTRCELLEERWVPAVDAGAYEIGTPNLINVWVDPLNGSDDRSGGSRDQALRSLQEAWARIPTNQQLAMGYQIALTAGDYGQNLLPGSGWMAERFGTYTAPVWIRAVDGPLSARLHGALNIQNCSYVYLDGLDFVTDRGTGGGGNVLQLASAHHILIRECRLSGFDGVENTAQETLKANQCQYVYVESSDISGAFWFGLDFVAVQYGHILNNVIHHTGDDGLLLKGGTAQFEVLGNTIHHTGSTGFAAGQGTGFEYMTAPWIHYEAYDIKFANNVIYDTQNAGMAVRGGYNILLANNTLYRVGQNSGSGSSMLLFAPGSRSVDENPQAARARHDMGGWGPTTLGEGGEWIPNKNVYVYNNVLYNPADAPTMWQTIDVHGPVNAPPGTNIPSPVRSDENLQIVGNMIFNGSADRELGARDAAIDALWRSQNSYGVFIPEFVNPLARDLRPSPDGNLFSTHSAAIPDFPGNDRPARPQPPLGDLSNLVVRDLYSNPRVAGSPVGAVASLSVSQPSPPQPPPETTPANPTPTPPAPPPVTPPVTPRPQPPVSPLPKPKPKPPKKQPAKKTPPKPKPVAKKPARPAPPKPPKAPPRKVPTGRR